VMKKIEATQTQLDQLIELLPQYLKHT
jgi:hypothetical protein